MKRTAMLVAAVLLALASGVSAQEPSHPTAEEVKKADALFYAAIDQLNARQYEKALDLFNQCLAIIPDARNAVVNRGICLSFMGRDEEALADLERGAKMVPPNRFIVGARARCYKHMGRTTDALKTLRDWVLEHPEDLVTRLMYADFLANFQKWQSAMAELDELVKLMPNDPRPFYQRGYVNGELHRNREGVADYSRVLELAPSDTATLNRRGLLYWALGELEKATADFTAVVQLHPNDPWAWANRAQVLRTTDLPRAMEDIRKAVALWPDRPDMYRILGSIQRLSGQYDDAVESFRTSLKMDPQHYQDQMFIGLCYQDAGDGQRALGAFKTLAENFPDLGLAHYYLGQGWRGLKRWDKALAEYDRCLALEPDRWYAIFSKAVCRVGQRDYPAARAAIAEARAAGDRLRQKAPADWGPVYGLACAAAIASTCHADQPGASAKAEADRKLAFEFLEESMRLGMWDITHISAEIDFAAIRNDKRFKAFLAKYQR